MISIRKNIFWGNQGNTDEQGIKFFEKKQCDYSHFAPRIMPTTDYARRISQRNLYG